jgi:hypothetical protein
MFIDAVSKYAPVAPLGGGAMVMLQPTTILWISSSGAPLAGVAPVRGYSSRRSLNGAPVGRLVHLRVETWWIMGQPNGPTQRANPTIQSTSQPRPQSKLHPNVEFVKLEVKPESTQSQPSQSQPQSQSGVNRLTPRLVFLKLRDLLSARNPLCTDISKIWYSALFAP